MTIVDLVSQNPAEPEVPVGNKVAAKILCTPTSKDHEWPARAFGPEAGSLSRNLNVPL